MNAHPRKQPDSWHEALITALAVGGFLIILGSVFGLTPGIADKIGAFFGDLTAVTYPVINGNIILPAPETPALHLDFFGAVVNFMVGIAVLQVVILALRFWAHSRIGRVSETVGNITFWGGGAAAAYVFLLSGTSVGWFMFWASLLIILGVSLIVRGIIHLVKRW